MRVTKIEDFLESHHIKYFTIKHAQAFTTLEIAANAHIPGKELAKTVMAIIDGKMVMVVLPACEKIDFKLLKEATGAGEATLAKEDEFQGMFSECEVGAMPPIGNLYGMDVYVDKSLTEDEDIAFNAGSHTDLIKMSYHDYEELVKPMVVNISHH